MKNYAIIPAILLPLAVSGCATAMPPAPYGGGGLATMSEQHALYLPREQGTGVFVGPPPSIQGASVSAAPSAAGTYDAEPAGGGAASSSFNAPALPR